MHINFDKAVQCSFGDISDSVFQTFNGKMAATGGLLSFLEF